MVLCVCMCKCVCAGTFFLLFNRCFLYTQYFGYFRGKIRRAREFRVTERERRVVHIQLGHVQPTENIVNLFLVTDSPFRN